MDDVIFGWDAPPMKEQFPMLSRDMCEHFDKDNEAIIRLHVRGFITDSMRDSAMKKVVRKIAAEISKACAD